MCVTTVHLYRPSVHLPYIITVNIWHISTPTRDNQGFGGTLFPVWAPRIPELVFVYLLMIYVSLSLWLFTQAKGQDDAPMGKAGEEIKQIQRTFTVQQCPFSFLPQKTGEIRIPYGIVFNHQDKLTSNASPTLAPLYCRLSSFSPSGLTSTHLPTHFTHLLLQSGTRAYRETSTHGLCSFLSTVERMLRIPGIYRLAAGPFPSSKLSPQKVRSLLHFLLLDIGT